MSLTKRILYALASHRPLRVIAEEGRSYLERYFLFRAFGVRCYLHRFVGDDPARGLHDHPWPWALSIILAGWYREHRRDGVRDVRWFNWLNGDRFHRVTLPQRRPVYPIIELICCWSLFIHRDRATKPWGFWKETPGGEFEGVKTMPDGTVLRNKWPRPNTADWQQFTYDTPEQMSSDEWWKDSARHPIAKHHPQRQPERLP
jgi:hypothetical protein